MSTRGLLIFAVIWISFSAFPLAQQKEIKHVPIKPTSPASWSRGAEDEETFLSRGEAPSIRHLCSGGSLIAAVSIYDNKIHFGYAIVIKPSCAGIGLGEDVFGVTFAVLPMDCSADFSTNYQWRRCTRDRPWLNPIERTRS